MVYTIHGNLQNTLKRSLLYVSQSQQRDFNISKIMFGGIKVFISDGLCVCVFC